MGDYSVILDAVRAHHKRGTRRGVLRRALLELAADSVAPLIERALEEVYA